ncbi:MAG TPA: TonB-dependent receptor [Bryobacteraceae bacterium]
MAFAAFAQTDRGSITGTVSDATGAVVPNAPVEIQSQATGTVYRGGASATGNFIVANLPVGQYTLTVTVNGFKKYVRQNIQVTVAVDTRADVALEIGTNAETVTVTESAPLLKTESGEVSHVVATEDADLLPVFTFASTSFLGYGNIRNPLQVLTLLPGMQFGQDGFGGQTLRINGLPSSTAAIRVEGQDISNGIWKEITTTTQSGVEAVQEVAVQTSNYAAEFGQAGGGYINFTMKSGTNQFHGSGYDYFVNEAFNAGLPYTDAGITNSLKDGQHIRNKVRRNDWGFTIGGPVKIPKVYDGHNKTFFFFNFEQYREVHGNTGFVNTVPTDAYRAGNFATASTGATLTILGQPAHDALGRTLQQYAIYDPTTTRQAPDGTVVRDLFPNQQIPAARLDPVALALQKFYPEPTNSNLFNNYIEPNFTNNQVTSNPSIKIDHSLSPTRKISGYWSRQKSTNPGNTGLDPLSSGVTPTLNRSDTIRLNYDESLKPTVLLHLGIGYLYTYNPSLPSNSFNESSIGLTGYYTNYFPQIGGGFGGITTGTTGGGYALGGGSFLDQQWDQKPTANANLTWVKGNHTYKFGGEFSQDGIINRSFYRGEGNFTVSANETANPWQNGQGLNSSTGFAYASFLLGQIDSFGISPPTSIKLGQHNLGFFAQDTWKVSRTLTVDYGLRYDFQTYLREQYGRMQSADFNTVNPVVGYPGAVKYEGYGQGRCNCAFSSNYPYAFGPRLNIAYQINPKTVLRAGVALSYGTTPENAQLSLNAADFYQFNAPGYGIAALSLSGGNPYAAGNPYGNPSLSWPNFDPFKYPTRTVCPNTFNATCYAPQTPFISIDSDSRPGRIFQWSIGFQRELNRNLVLEATYIGNRGAWFEAPVLDVANYNALNITDLSKFGLNLANAADRTLITSPIGSTAAVQRGFFPAYTGMPSTQTVIQNIRPRPQWGGVPPFLGPPLGDTWYDSLQTKLTKRFSHGLQAQGSFTWAKELVNGANSDTSYFTPGALTINDVYNLDQNKQISSLSRPMAMVISGTYQVPKPSFTQKRYISQVLKDWTLGTLLRYQSGALIAVPQSNNQLLTELGRGPGAGIAGFGGGYTYYNFANGNHNLFSVDPNSHFDPTKTLALNSAAWVDAPFGQFGTTAPYYNNYRWQRQPAESLNFGRIFAMGREGKYQLQIRAEFQNIFNRHSFSAPSSTNPATPVQSNNALVQGGRAAGALSAGFGYVSFLNGAGDQPRTGLLVARFQF